jgi:pimeloyl-ACP methyl ester carboxylesterase
MMLIAKHKSGLKTRWEFVFVVQQYWYGWRRQIRPPAQAGFRLLIPDQRSYNLSDKPKGVKAYRLYECPVSSGDDEFLAKESWADAQELVYWFLSDPGACRLAAANE